MKFFCDQCIALTYVRAVRVLAEIQKYEIKHLSELFSPSTPDTVWLKALASQRDWVIVSGDPRISRSKAERAAWHESGLTAFFLADGWASRGYWNQATDLVKWWPQIVLKAREAGQGTGYFIHWNSRSMRVIYEP